MDPRAILGISVLMSFVSSVVIAKLYVWPKLRTMNRNDWLIRLVAPHLFFRFIGLSFIVPGGCFFAAASRVCGSHRLW